jgi:hypothetical protein
MPVRSSLPVLLVGSRSVGGSMRRFGPGSRGWFGPRRRAVVPPAWLAPGTHFAQRLDKDYPPLSSVWMNSASSMSAGTQRAQTSPSRAVPTWPSKSVGPAHAPLPQMRATGTFDPVSSGRTPRGTAVDPKAARRSGAHARQIGRRTALRTRCGGARRGMPPPGQGNRCLTTPWRCVRGKQGALGGRPKPGGPNQAVGTATRSRGVASLRNRWRLCSRT